MWSCLNEDIINNTRKSCITKTFGFLFVCREWRGEFYTKKYLNIGEKKDEKRWAVSKMHNFVGANLGNHTFILENN